MYAVLFLMLASPTLVLTSLSSEGCPSQEELQLQLPSCALLSCRNKCNQSMEELASVYCRCDEQCYMYNDCCVDFHTECPETLAVGKLKFPRNSSFRCLHGSQIVYSHGEVYLPSTTPFSTSTASTTTTAITDSSNNEWLLSSVSWLGSLSRCSNQVLDKTYGIIYINLGVYEKNAKPDSDPTFMPCKAKLVVRDQSVFNGDLNRANLRILSSTSQPQMRSCNKDIQWFICDNCDKYIYLQNVCFPKPSSNLPVRGLQGNDNKSGMVQAGFSRIDAEDTHVKGQNEMDEKSENFTKNSSRLCESSADLQDKFFRNSISFATATLEMDIMTVRSVDLPWSVIRCHVNRCVVEECSKTRVLSDDRSSCFKPSRISIFSKASLPPSASASKATQMKRKSKSMSSSSKICSTVMRHLGLDLQHSSGSRSGGQFPQESCTVFVNQSPQGLRLNARHAEKKRGENETRDSLDHNFRDYPASKSDENLSQNEKEMGKKNNLSTKNDADLDPPEVTKIWELLDSNPDVTSDRNSPVIVELCWEYYVIEETCSKSPPAPAVEKRSVIQSGRERSTENKEAVVCERRYSRCFSHELPFNGSCLQRRGCFSLALSLLAAFLVTF